MQVRDGNRSSGHSRSNSDSGGLNNFQMKMPKYDGALVVDKHVENKLHQKEREIPLKELEYDDFENNIKKYGYIGTVTVQHMDEVKLTKRFLKNNELADNKTRISKYFNSDLIHVKDRGKW